MADEVRIEVEPNRQMRIHKIRDVTKLTDEEINNFVDTVARAYKAKKPAQEDLSAIRKFLKDYPEMCRAVFSLVDSTQSLIIKNMMGVVPAEIAMEEYLVSIRDEMGYHEAPIMEKLLIENIVTAWLHVQYCESTIAFMMGKDRSIVILEFWERRLSIAQKRYLAASESLVKIRKMKIPAMQFNIGDKQVNVAGDLKPGTTEIINV
jgi:hypothetical protein